LRGVGRRYPGRSEKAAVACALVYFTLFRLHDGDPEDGKTARRLAAEYRACSGVLLTLPEPVKGAALPPCWRAVAPPSPVTSAEHRPQKHLPPVGALDARQFLRLRPAPETRFGIRDRPVRGVTRRAGRRSGADRRSSCARGPPLMPVGCLTNQEATRSPHGVVP
jgi:hypothetical protein